MIEAVCDAVQLAILAACLILSLWRAFTTRGAVWFMLACFFGCMLLGNVNWLGYQVVFGETPTTAFIEDLSWTAGLLFLALIEKQCDDARAPSPPVPVAWIPVTLCAACCVFFIASNGEPLLNVAENGLLAAVGFFAVRGLAIGSGDGFSRNRLFHGAMLAYVIVEEALWLSSCFLWPGEIVGINPYIAFDYALTLASAALLVSAWRCDEL
jgi:hypothetical protein